MNSFHTPALKIEAIDVLNVHKGAKYIDATIGGGGHSFEILKRGGIVLGIDLDQEAIDYVNEKIKNQKSSSAARAKIKIGEDLVLVHGNFRDIEEIARSHGFGRVAGILFDLGVSSYQLETGSRGFSFQKDATLDMRMDPSGLKITAKDLVDGLTKGELYELFTRLGQEKLALAISDHIVRARKIKPIETTGELANIVLNVYKRRVNFGKLHPATRVFQALRIAVNGELYNLEQALPSAYNLLENKGRLVVISFHSLEDKIVKSIFKRWTIDGRVKILTKKPIRPSQEEIIQNVRSRSAKMRAVQKI